LIHLLTLLAEEIPGTGMGGNPIDSLQRHFHSISLVVLEEIVFLEVKRQLLTQLGIGRLEAGALIEMLDLAGGQLFRLNFAFVDLAASAPTIYKRALSKNEIKAAVLFLLLLLSRAAAVAVTRIFVFLARLARDIDRLRKVESKQKWILVPPWIVQLVIPLAQENEPRLSVLLRKVFQHCSSFVAVRLQEKFE
jgi:hypothetical protein